MINNEMKIRKTDLLAVLLFLPFFNLESFKYLMPVLSFASMFGVVFVLLFLFFAFFWIKRIHLDKYFWGLIVFWAWHFFLTYHFEGEWSPLVGATVRTVAMYFYIRIIILYYRASTKYILFLFIGLFAVNLITFFLFPQGMYTMYGSNGSFYSNEVWILGGKNGYFCFMFFAIALYLLNFRYYSCDFKTTGIHYKRKKMNNLFLSFMFYFLIVINTFLVSKSVTLMIGISMIIVYLALAKNNLFGKRSLTVMYFAFFSVAIYFLLFSNTDNWLLKMISDFTGKSITLSGRTLIWQRSINAIHSIFPLGTGFQNPLQFVITMGQTTSHDKYLWIIYRGGLIAFILFCSFIIDAARNLINNYNLIISKDYMLMLIVLLILWVVEVYDNNHLIYGFLLFCCYIQKLVPKSRS